VGTCYQGALDKINSIHRQNEERSLRAEHELNSSLTKNSHLQEIISKKRRSVSCINQEVAIPLPRKARYTIIACPSCRNGSTASSRNTAAMRTALLAHSDTSRRRAIRPRNDSLSSSRDAWRNGRRIRNEWIRPREKSPRNAPAFSYSSTNTGKDQQLFLPTVDFFLPRHCPRVAEVSGAKQISD
jgi:hypothetical protein